MASTLRKEVRNTKQEMKVSWNSTNIWKQAVRTLGLVSVYFLTSIGLTFYQSSLLKKIKFPLSIVAVHFLLKLVLAWGCRSLYSLYSGQPRVSLGWSGLLGRVGLVAVVASLDIGLSQSSFQYIQVALYTVTKSTSIIFILFFAIILGLERKHWSLIFIIGLISSGLVMFTYKSTDFSIIGFSMVLSASFLSGIRWTLSQLIMQRSNLGLSNPIDMIFHIQPFMILTLLPFIAVLEGPRIFNILTDSQAYNLEMFSIDILEIIAGGVLAFLMESGEFLLLAYTSSLTLSISGILKEIITMGLAVVFQSTDLSLVNLVGLAICLLGICVHVIKKALEAENPSKSIKYSRAQTSETDLRLLSDSDDSEEELYRTNKPRKRSVTEEVLMQDNRQWTSVRDAHLDRLAEAQDTAQLEYKMEDSIHLVQVAGDEEENGDALAEADKLLEQLDLLSSD